MILNDRTVPDKLLVRMQHAIAEVDTMLCVGCSYCHLACPYDTILMRDGLAVIEPECTACWVCASHCPVDAISRGERGA